MQTINENSLARDRRFFSKEAFRKLRYCEAEHISPLDEYPKKNRICVSGIDAAWGCTGWKELFNPDEGFVRVRIKYYSVALYENGCPIGIAKFECFMFNDLTDSMSFIDAADSESQELYDLSEGVLSVLNHLNGSIDEFIFKPKMRIIVFQRLVMRREHSASNKWVSPINEFIKKEFRKSNRACNYALLLRPFPLEFENGAREIGQADDARLGRRRRALARLYERTLNVKLAVPETDSSWWMGRYL